MKRLYLDIYNAANANAIDLLSAGKNLYRAKKYSQAYVLGFSALEEISKGQLAADVFTGLVSEEKFKNSYRSHTQKIERVEWAHYDASSYPHNLKWIGPDTDDFEQIDPTNPLFSKRQNALFVDVDFKTAKISKPKDVIREKDAKGILHIVDVALERIWEVTGEFGGNQIGTKGFMK